MFDCSVRSWSGAGPGTDCSVDSLPSVTGRVSERGPAAGITSSFCVDKLVKFYVVGGVPPCGPLPRSGSRTPLASPLGTSFSGVIPMARRHGGRVDSEGSSPAGRVRRGLVVAWGWVALAGLLTVRAGIGGEVPARGRGRRRSPRTWRRSCRRSARTATASIMSGRSPWRRTSRHGSAQRISPRSPATG